MNVYLLLFMVILLSETLADIYIPGVTPNEFNKGELIDVKAVKMTSAKTQIPYEYYELKFCSPKIKTEYYYENIGAILRGDRLVSTPFEVKMAVDTKCTLLCDPVTLKNDEASGFSSFIADEYLVHLVMDNLPVATRSYSLPGNSYHYVHGYKLGISTTGANYINNHLNFRLQYNVVNDDKYRLVGFEVEPLSISSEHMKTNQSSCALPQDPNDVSKWQRIDENTKQIQFSYTVTWEASSVRWASRWDIFLKFQDGQVHWFSLLNSLVVILFLTALIAVILIRNIRRDIDKYNRDDIEDIIEESGWKLMHGDVFRPPNYVTLLTALFGSGVQLFCMVFIIIFFAMLGTMSPESRGTVMTSALFTYVFMGLFAGYFAGRFYKTLRGLMWKSTAIFTAALYPTIILFIGSLLNTFLWYKGSSAAVPFTTVLALLSMWLGISLPLTYLGFYFGYRKRPYAMPVRTNHIPRAIPERKVYQNIVVTTLLCGIPPFCAVFIEVFFIYLAIWSGQFYYLFGFLFMVFIVLIVCVAQVAVVRTYVQLCNEDYQWWWHTFISSGGLCLYVFLYSVYYCFFQLQITEFVPTVVYFGYTTLIVITFWILTGTIGLATVFVFLQHIYSVIKID